MFSWWPTQPVRHRRCPVAPPPGAQSDVPVPGYVFLVQEPAS